MRISDWSSDVCSSDLMLDDGRTVRVGSDIPEGLRARMGIDPESFSGAVLEIGATDTNDRGGLKDRKSVVQGKTVSVRVDLGGRRIIKKINSSTISSLAQHK